ncbi:amidohydrolase family protein [Bailinhaonella thermotolerans]|uniref:Amidohydrolase n=1 Tax=Bailinhaonella thermotolerans TaxID=1070861 RepID=A0A3A4AJ14_9ACTN|nr:amidohydrolase family protein [Bailinhaonella thermotolerans]RJL20810.1 amidohydrolase [Bailinhaonella thermotolerans]
MVSDAGTDIGREDPLTGEPPRGPATGAPGEELAGLRLPDAVREALLGPLIDHHCHGVRRDDLGRARFELLVTEAGTPAPPGTTHFDTPAGAALRRWCAPVLGLEPHAQPAVYLSRRAELGAEEVNRRLLRRAGIRTFLVDTGIGSGPEYLGPDEMGLLGGGTAREIVRLERVERDVAADVASAVHYASRLSEELDRRAEGAVALKTIIAYRCGLDFDPEPPSRGELLAAAARRVADPKARLSDPVLLRNLLWTGVDVARERGLPLQFHTGYGDADLDLDRCDPARMSGFLRRAQPSGVPIVLLHCYPFHRSAAYLAAVFPQVYADLGLSLTYTAAGSAAVVAETLELVPWHKLLFSSDCYGLAEFAHLGALYYRRGLGRALESRLAEGELSVADAARVAHITGSGNARRLYRL